MRSTEYTSGKSGICITLCSKCFNKIKRIHDEKFCASEVKENVIHENL